MQNQTRRTHYRNFIGRLVMLFTMFALATAQVSAQSSPGVVQRIHTLYPSEWGIFNEAGLTYSSTLNQFFLLKQGGRDQAVTSASLLVVLSSNEELIDTLDLDVALDSAINLAFDDSTLSLYLFNNSPAELLRIQIGANHTLDLTTLTRFAAADWGVAGADGIAVDAKSHILYILDRKANQLKSIVLTATGPDAAQLRTVDLAALRTAQVRGMASNPQTGLLYTISHRQSLLYELTATGDVITTYALNSLELIAARSLVFAASADLTDAGDTLHLFLLDSKKASDLGVIQADPNPGDNAIFLPLVSQSDTGAAISNAAESTETDRYAEIIELVLVTQENLLNAASANAITLNLIRTINTAAFSAHSPDPSGLAYLPARNTLLLTDGEVEETVNFGGANVWEISLRGSVARSANVSTRSPTIVALTNEPTGIAWNPNNGHYYISDDDKQEVYDLNPGGDNKIGSSDDRWTSFDTARYGNQDTEGIAYNPTSNRLFVVDGVNAEVYQYTTAGTLISQFDVQRYGVIDPESVEFNPFSGTLFVLSNHTNRIIIETTMSGTLLQTFNVAASNSLAAAGFAYAPASDGSGVQRFYIADRGIDNDGAPRENDGKIYEMSAPQPSNATITPVATVSPTPTSTTPVATPTPTNATATVVVTPSSTPAKVTITIIEQSTPKNAQDFSYFSAFGAFRLDDAPADDLDGVSSSITFANRNPGFYNFSQAKQSGWKLLAIQCTPNNKVTIDLAMKNAAISAAAGEQITCTFVNQALVE